MALAAGDDYIGTRDHGSRITGWSDVVGPVAIFTKHYFFVPSPGSLCVDTGSKLAHEYDISIPIGTSLAMTSGTHNGGNIWTMRQFCAK
ncbi:MAG: hypothetical protein K6T99_03050 [Armatimonadetes bacterium]|nr:hypothetical protein [Armatimonadota bacterium]